MLIYPRESQCLRCKHFAGAKWTGKHEASEAFVCTAFPAGIPDLILLDKFDHTKPYPGDHGVRFEPAEVEVA